MMRLTGLIAAPHTPMLPDGSVNVELIQRQAEHLIAKGVAGAFVGGTTGECHSLTVEERLTIAKRWVDVAAGTDLKVIIHAGHNCQADARTLANQAQQIGADAVAALAPTYFKPATVDDLIGFLAPVAAEAPDLPFYYYDIPAMTGLQLPAVDLLERGKPRMPNLHGAKFTNHDLVMLQQCLQFGGGAFDVLFGCDEILLAGWTLGARGAVGSTYNFAAPLYGRVIEAVAAGDLGSAQAGQMKAVQMINLLRDFGFLAASKVAMSMAGIDCGPVRPPLRNLTVDQRNDLLMRLEELDGMEHRLETIPAISV